MMIEEHYDDILILTRAEKILNNVLNQQLYLHYNLFARVQSVTASLSITNRKNSTNFDQSLLE